MAHAQKLSGCLDSRKFLLHYPYVVHDFVTECEDFIGHSCLDFYSELSWKLTWAEAWLEFQNKYTAIWIHWKLYETPVRAGSRKHCFFSQKRMWDSSNSFRMNSQLKSHGVHHTCLQQIYSCTSILPTREWPQHSKSSQGLWTRCEQEDGEGEWGRLKARTKHRKNAIRIYFEPLQRPVNNGSSGVPEVSGISQPLSNSTAKTDSLSTFLD